MKRSTQIYIDTHIKHPRFAKMARAKATVYLLTRLRIEHEKERAKGGPCYCGLAACIKCHGYKMTCLNRKAEGLWEGPGTREWSLWPAVSWA